MKFSTVADWLTNLQVNELDSIKLGLERVHYALDKLDLPPFKCPFVTVGGTNGKGSTVKGLEHIFCSAGYNVGSFTSPALFVFNEQIRINEIPATDETILNAFDQISKLEDIDLTPFEFQTLAALLIFSSITLDLVILEVGLGGRLDAVNVIDADIAVITSIGIDHTAWLGDTREEIAKEKSGIFRKGRPAVIGELDIPHSIYQTAAEKGTELYRQGHEFLYQQVDNYWNWHYNEVHLKNLPLPKIALQNMSTVLMVVKLLQHRLPVTNDIIYKSCQEIEFVGRIQVIDNHIYDVSHNPASVALLADFLKKHPIKGKTIAIFSMFADKDIKGSIECIANEINVWWVAPLNHQRAASLSLLDKLLNEKNAIVNKTHSIKNAIYEAKQKMTHEDRLVIFGSFHTVKEALEKNQSSG